VTTAHELAVGALRSGHPDGRCDHELANKLATSLVALSDWIHSHAALAPLPAGAKQSEGDKPPAAPSSEIPVAPLNATEGNGGDKPKPNSPKLGRRKLVASTDPKAKAKHNVYSLIRAAKEQNTKLKGPADLSDHFKDNRDFKEQVKAAGLKFGEKLFRAAREWMTRNPTVRHEMPSRNDS